MKKIESEDTHKGWTFAVSSSGLRGAVIQALSKEFDVSGKNIELAPFRLLNQTAKTFTFRARIGVRIVVGVAQIDVAIYQSKPGEEYVSTFVRVSYQT